MNAPNNASLKSGSERHERKGISWREILGGGAAGIVAGGIAGNATFTEGMIKGEGKQHLLNTLKAARRDFKAANPQPADAIPGSMALGKWLTDANNAGRHILEETRKAILEKLEKLGPLAQKFEDAGKAGKIVGNPVLNFAFGGLKTKVTLGAIVAASALAVGYGIHKFRNRHAEKPSASHVEREQQRAEQIHNSLALPNPGL